MAKRQDSRCHSYANYAGTGGQSMSSNTYIVTGCAGFIASRVTRMLLDAGEHVLGIDNLNGAYDVELKRWRLDELLQYDRFSVMEADIAHTGTVDEIARVVDTERLRIGAVLNLAARAGVQQSVARPQPYIQDNVTGTLNMLELSRRLGVSKFVLASSSSVYGNSSVGPASEDMPTDQPLSPYAASKRAAELLAHSYHHLHRLDVSVLRYFTVYGPAGRPDMSILRFVKWIASGQPVTLFGDGSQERDFTYIDDIASGTIAALRPVGYQVFNLGSDRPYRLSTLIAMIEEASGQEAVIDYQPALRADVRATWADISRAREMLGWSPRVPLRQGIQMTVDWYLENRKFVDSLDLDATGRDMSLSLGSAAA